MTNSVLFAKARKIKMLILDVDGVMTNGQILLTPQGEELKFFSIHDGYGMVCAMKAGIRLGIISGRSSPAIRMRCEELKITDLYMNTMEKLPVLNQILEKYSLLPEEVAYIGDDVPDLPVLLKAGFSAAPQNAHLAVKKKVDLVLSKSGGDGAVREFIDFILLAQNKEKL
jgi:3-deoxy-D-manno-octulosonate 8-phosphate phosphatase (KDO 8-P phosphatase)